MSQQYLDLIHDLQRQLEVLQTAIANQSEPAPAIVSDWLRSQSQIQAFFHDQIVNIEMEIKPQHLSLQVEIDKQLKMFGVDLSMLRAARNPTTWQKRHQQICDRLVLLNKYFQMH
ncbi:heterocyst frequency control protein PatD [Pseudanabaena sp. FACHB-723]|uniref:Heterocyst frequency control protein PatD n=1 Tax=Pseudanabaena mucicola FACHB-723 TaxID=2692860 RepID=A0ABR7ZZ81_9CYAN|nr:heterocyst frequency control protein PatD [Pseudanabaena mucicola FACHB-723]